ncbi:hypothetical protein MFLAVUS_004580 [Mucor flavus]|uniref:Aurora kinase n=1 Tax=Mucor flavus TaxID=439312 RepID=A0ABP9YWB2_9FUNG
MPKEIFKSPVRRPNTNPITAPLSEYVDYTPRRDLTAQDLDHNPNSISYAKERRTQYYQQMALESEDPLGDVNYMDSPIVRRHYGIDYSPPSYFDNKMRQALDQDFLSRKKSWNIKDFSVEEYLGGGKFGLVWRAVERRTKKTVAIKILKKEEVEAANVVLFLKREIEIQVHLDHPHIVRLYGYFHDDDRVYLVMEYVGTLDLYSVLTEKKQLTEAEVVRYLLQLTDAVKYMHSLGVIHRDIKLENILVNKNNMLKIADFGWSVFDPKPRRNTFCGTLDYLPPEMIQNEPHTNSVDMWALGVLAYEMLAGYPPFSTSDQAENPQRTYERITKVDLVFDTNMSSGAKSFISKLLVKNPLKRMTASDIESDPWIVSTK